MADAVTSACRHGLRPRNDDKQRSGEIKISSYQKFSYWLTETDFHFLKESLSPKGTDFFASKRAVCVSLSKEVEIGFVPTDAWGKYPFCRRPLSWYKASPFAGRVLVVSSFDLGEYHFSPETVIRESDFKPPKLPDRKGKLKLIEQESYQKAKPPEWENIDAEGPELYNQWLRMMGLRGVSYEELFITHCANLPISLSRLISSSKRMNLSLIRLTRLLTFAQRAWNFLILSEPDSKRSWSSPVQELSSSPECPPIGIMRSLDLELSIFVDR